MSVPSTMAVSMVGSKSQLASYSPNSNSLENIFNKNFLLFTLDSHRVVGWLWDVLEEFNEEEKKLFLKVHTFLSY